MSDSREVLLKLGAQFTGWKGADLKPLAMQARAAQEATDKLKESFERAGVASNNAGRMAGKMMQEMGTAHRAGLNNPFAKFDVTSVSRFDASLKQLARTNMELALATQKGIDAERQRRAEMTQSAFVQQQLERRGLGASPMSMGSRIMGGFGALSRIAGPIAAPLAGLKGVQGLADEIPNLMNMRAGKEFDPERAGFLGRQWYGLGKSGYESWNAMTAPRNRFREAEGSEEANTNNAARMNATEQRTAYTRANWDTRARTYQDTENEQFENISQGRRLGVRASFDVGATAGRYRNRSQFEAEGFAGLAADRAGTPTLNIVPGAASAYRMEQEQARARANQLSLMGIPEARELAVAQQDHSRSTEHVGIIRRRLAQLEMGPAARGFALKHANENYVNAAHQRTLAEQRYDSAVDSGGDVTGAAAARQRAILKEVEAQRELESIQRSINDRANERLRLNEQLANATKAQVADETRLAEATKAAAAAEREKLQVQKDFHGQQKNKYQGIAEGEREKQKDLAVNYLTMDPLQRFQTASIAKKLAAARAGKLKPGQPQIRWINGRPQRVAGTGGGLTHEEMQIASSNPFLHNQFREYASQATQQDPILKQIMGFEGTTGRESEANNRSEFHATAETNIKVQIEMDDKAVTQEINDKLVPQIIQAITSRVHDLAEQVQGMFSQQSNANRAAQ